MSNINSRPSAPIRSYTPGPPDTTNNFLTEQISKQQRSNFHSTSLNHAVAMAATTVNKTALHPRGVAYVAPVVKNLPRRARSHVADRSSPHRPQHEHTEIEEELHEKAHIDYDRVAIVRPVHLSASMIAED